MGVRLADENLGALPKSFSLPQYDRSQLKTGILHIGPSAFMRAHLAVFADDLLSKRQAEGQPLDCGITAVCIKNRGRVREAIGPQDFLYTLTSKGKNGSNSRVIGSIRDIVVAEENPEIALEAAADPNVKVISLTVTQGGYYFTPEKGFDFENADIRACLTGETQAMSSIGLIVKALQLRRDRGIAPPTIMSCDNLAGNGTILQGAVEAYAKLVDPELEEWIHKYVAFPNTMVDRITPITTQDHTDVIRGEGVEDRWPIQSEPMPNMPFVIENRRSIDPATGERVEFPDFASVGALVTDDVHSYETLKVRMLNGAHMALGCIGYLAGYRKTHEAMQDPAIRRFVIGFMNEAAQVLRNVKGVSHSEYMHDLIERLDNDKICDTLSRLARNGSEKIGPRILDTMRECVSSPGRSYQHMAFAVASWMEYLKLIGPEGKLQGASLEDMANGDVAAVKKGLTRLIAEDVTNPAPLMAAHGVFGMDLPGNPKVVADIRAHLTAISTRGAHDAVDFFVDNVSAIIPPPLPTAAEREVIVQPSHVPAGMPQPLYN